jgi:superfamily II DNA helicase RecQ
MQQNVINDDESLKEDASKALKNPCEKPLFSVLLPMFSLNYFYKGHMVTIEHVLNFQNIMFNLPTKVGKSFCYQHINMLK